MARRWLRVFRWRRDDIDAPQGPDELAVAMLLADPDAVAVRRGRLANLSWFMRALCEPIARRANREDGVTGRFFEGRFKSQAVLDEPATLACSMYVDLNPIRAGIAETPESSQYTAAFERIAARQAAAAEQHAQDPPPHGAAVPRRDDWLSPIPTEDVCAASERPHSPHRASDRGFLPLNLDDYLALLDWTGRQIRADKRGAIPAHLRPILERLSINADNWIETMLHFGRRFQRVIGRTASIVACAQQRGRHWFQGQAASRLAFT